MKKLIILFGILLTSVFAVVQAQDSSLKNIDDFYMDLSVSDLSAFQMLSVNPSQVLKPSSAKEFAIGFSGLDSSGKIKPGFALSWSPFQTFNKTAKSVADYRKNYYWKYAFQLTSATNSDSTGSNLAFGINWVPIDNSNILLHSEVAGMMNGIINEYTTGEDKIFNVVKNGLFKQLINDKSPVSVTEKMKTIDTIESNRIV